MKHLWIALIVLCSLGLIFHPGRTDEDGGHTDSSTGEYHYHHGFPAHQHPNGVCPYEGQEPYYSSDTAYSERSTSSKSTWWKNALWILAPFAFVGAVAAVFKGIEIAGDKIIEERKYRRARKMYRGK